MDLFFFLLTTSWILTLCLQLAAQQLCKTWQQVAFLGALFLLLAHWFLHRSGFLITYLLFCCLFSKTVPHFPLLFLFVCLVLLGFFFPLLVFSHVYLVSLILDQNFPRWCFSIWWALIHLECQGRHFWRVTFLWWWACGRDVHGWQSQSDQCLSRVYVCVLKEMFRNPRQRLAWSTAPCLYLLCFSSCFLSMSSLLRCLLVSLSHSCSLSFTPTRSRGQMSGALSRSSYWDRCQLQTKEINRQ